MNETLKIFLDMDYVLTNFSKGYKKLSHDISIGTYAELYGKESAKDIFLNAGTKFWEELEWIDGGRELFDAASSLFKHVFILSSTGTTDEDKAKIVEEGKRNWLKVNIPSILPENIFIVKGRHLKQEYSNSDSILVDDLEDTIKSWDSRGGIGILHDFNNYQDTIDELEILSLSGHKIKLKELISTRNR
jgi:hypothetical protein